MEKLVEIRKLNKNYSAMDDFSIRSPTNHNGESMPPRINTNSDN